MMRPQKYLNRTILFLIGVIIVCAVLFPKMQDAFATNPMLNGLIATVLLFGIIISMRQTYMLIPALNWLESFKKNESSEVTPEAPELLGAMATMMEEQKDRKMALSTMSMRTLLDGIAARMDEGREITRYIVGLLIFLGLLGTFWGLLTTIGSIGDTIDSLRVGSGDVGLMFEHREDFLITLKIGSAVLPSYPAPAAMLPLKRVMHRFLPMSAHFSNSQQTALIACIRSYPVVKKINQKLTTL